MLSAVERLKIFENIRARVGNNNDADVLGEYAKAMSSINGLQTMTEMNPPPMPTTNGINGNYVDNTQQIPPSEGTLPPLGDNGTGGLGMP